MARSSPTYIQTRLGRHSLRLRVPADLAEAFGRTEIIRALGTTDEMRARIVAGRIMLRFRRLWDMVREAGRIPVWQLQEIADTWLRREIEREWALLESGDFARQLQHPDMPRDEARAENRRLFGEDAQHRLAAATAEFQAHDFTRMEGAAESLLADGRPGTAARPQERAALAKLLMVALGDLQGAKVAWSEGDAGYTPASLLRPAEAVQALPEPAAPAASTPSTTPASCTVEDAISAYVATLRQRRLKEKQITDAAGDLQLLVEAFGAKSLIENITSVEAGRIWTALNSLPPHFRRREELANLNLFDKAKRAAELQLQPLNPRTMKSYLGTLSNFFEHEKMAGHVTENPFLEKKVKRNGRVARQERTFKASELEVLFGSPVFQGAKGEKQIYEPGDFLLSDWMFWAPVIALLSGARIGEIVQLRPCDIRSQDGIDVIDVNEAGAKSLKNVGTARLIPIHSRLLSLGLIELAARRAVLGHTLLLPGVPKPIKGDQGAGASKWMSERFLHRLHLHTRPGLGFHSFRHTLKTALRSAGVSEPDSELIRNVLVCG
jgi:integrase